ncbi:unnamed protein product [Vitrella brassicaformis CCMP3155]|uniref:EF-hand domain-containing protein n=1 Tax=Vitrella brassicaformis (strain CCMP3155) TaxID=1169540 RepID=A0A0G4GGB5_VITBC|nr:unnamed protein product [Vitrella brassicaformis CCMP3155]|eukprot:CEM28658.1 unnamed protein product [Vitrella brassicaformis CCMP3155]
MADLAANGEGGDIHDGDEEDLEPVRPAWTDTVNKRLAISTLEDTLRSVLNKSADGSPSKFQSTGKFREDYENLCELCGLPAAHPSLCRPPLPYLEFYPTPAHLLRPPDPEPDIWGTPAAGPLPVSAHPSGRSAHDPFAAYDEPDKGEERKDEYESVWVHGMKVDIQSLVLLGVLVRVMAKRWQDSACPISNCLGVLKFITCHLDIYHLRILRRMLGPASTIRTLHLDWNPMRLPGDYYKQVRLAVKKLDEEKRGALQSTRLQALRQKLVDKCANLQDAFRRFDLNKDRKISWEEFARALYKLRFAPYDIHFCFAILDTNEDNFLDFDEFVTTMESLPEPTPSDKPSPPPAPLTDTLPQCAVPSPVEAAATMATYDEGSFVDPWSRALGNIISPTATLERLSLRSCGLDARCSGPLVEMLQANTRLKVLNLYGNRLDDRCCEAMGTALYFNRTLECLLLARNPVTDRGLQNLTKYLGCTVVPADELKAIQGLVKEQQKTLQSFQQQKEKDKAAAAKAGKTDEAAPTIDQLISSGIEDDETAGGEGAPTSFLAPLADRLEENVAAGEGQPPVHLLWRNCSLKLLHLENTNVESLTLVSRLQKRGPPKAFLFLKGTPAAAEHVRRQTETKTASADLPPAPAEPTGPAEGEKESVPPQEQPPQSAEGEGEMPLGGPDPLDKVRLAGWRIKWSV